MSSMYFWVKCRIELAGGARVPADKKWGVISAFGLNFFKSLQVLINGYELSPGSEQDSGYKAYLESLLSFEYGKNRNFHLKSSIYELDDQGYVDNCDHTAAGNTAFKKRHTRVSALSFDFCVPFLHYFARSDAHLTPQNKLTVVATRQSEEFLINTLEKTTPFKISVEDIRLYYNR